MSVMLACCRALVGTGAKVWSLLGTRGGPFREGLRKTGK